MAQLRCMLASVTRPNQSSFWGIAIATLDRSRGFTVARAKQKKWYTQISPHHHIILHPMPDRLQAVINSEGKMTGF